MKKKKVLREYIVPIVEEVCIPLRSRSEVGKTTKCSVYLVRIFEDGTTKVKKNLTKNQIDKYWDGVEKRRVKHH